MKIYEPVKPLVITAERPLISFILLAYNQEKFIREAVEGAFSQTYSPLEIILSDDCSPDATFEIMKEMAEAYRGPHKIVLNRNPKNLGLVPHFNKVMEIASGEIIVCAAGDDISLPDRTEKSWQILHSDSNLSAISMRTENIDIKGRVLKKNKNIGSEPTPKIISIQQYLRDTPAKLSYGFLAGGSRAFRRTAFDKFGPLANTCPTEDSTMRLRCLMLGNYYCSSEIGVKHRAHPRNISKSIDLNWRAPARIYRQYMRDLRFGLKSKLINLDIVQEAQELGRRIYKRRMIFLHFQASKSKLLFFVFKVLCSRDLIYSEKRRMLVMIIKGHLL